MKEFDIKIPTGKNLDAVAYEALQRYKQRNKFEVCETRTPRSLPSIEHNMKIDIDKLHKMRYECKVAFERILIGF